MAVIVIIDEVDANAALLASYFTAAGHRARIYRAPVVPQAIASEQPDLIVVGLHRQHSPMRGPAIGGLAALTLLHHPVVAEVPRMAIGYGLDVNDLPAHVEVALYLCCEVEPEICIPIAAQLADERLLPAPEPPEGDSGEVQVILRCRPGAEPE